MTGAELGAARLALGVAQAELGLLLGGLHRRQERALLPWLSAQLRDLALGSEAGPAFFVPPSKLQPMTTLPVSPTLPLARTAA